MKVHKNISGLSKLIDAIAAGSFDPADPGPQVVEIHTDKGLVITGSYSRAQPDITSLFDIIAEDNDLRPLVEKLIGEGKSFVTQTGEDDSVCTLIWEVKKK